MAISLYNGKDLLGMEHLDWISKHEIFRTTTEIKAMHAREDGKKALKMLLRKNGEPLLFRIIFKKESFRRRTIFENAILSMGGRFISSNIEQFSSGIIGGEIIEPLIYDLANECDGLILRFPDSKSIIKAADICDAIGARTKIISAGDAVGNHPIQTLSDLFTIKEKMGLTEGILVYAFIGDIQKSAAVHSLLLALKEYLPKKIYLITTDYSLTSSRLAHLKLEKQINYQIIKINNLKELDKIAEEIDIWYVTQFYRGEQYAPVPKVGDWLLKSNKIKQKAIFLHPSPYGKEYREGLAMEDKRFLHHSGNDFYVTMAILKLMFADHVDLKIAEAEEKMVNINGEIENLPISVTKISGVCAGKNCASIKVLGKWGAKLSSMKEKEKLTALGKAYVFCEKCGKNR